MNFVRWPFTRLVTLERFWWVMMALKCLLCCHGNQFNNTLLDFLSFSLSILVHATMDTFERMVERLEGLVRWTGDHGNKIRIVCDIFLMNLFLYCTHFYNKWVLSNEEVLVLYGGKNSSRSACASFSDHMLYRLLLYKICCHWSDSKLFRFWSDCAGLF